jgi:hypothetical protein
MEQPVSTLSELMTPRALSERWGCSVGHLANLRSAGLGPAYLKIGSAVRYRVDDLLAYERARTVENGSLSTGQRGRT